MIYSDQKLPAQAAKILKKSQLFSSNEFRSILCQSLPGQAGKSHQLFLVEVQRADTELTDLPARYFIKFGKSSKEYYFYTSINKKIRADLLPVCYYTEYDPELDQTGLILEDLSLTHFQTDWPLPPSNDDCYLTVQKLAEVQAAFWQDPCLENEFRSQIPPGRSWTARRKLALDKIPDFLNFLGDRISAKDRKIYQSLRSTEDQLLEKSQSSSHQTLLHGDMHVWNVFYPREHSAELRFIDWNMWDIGIPTDDLAYLIAIHWVPLRRERLEKNLLVSYHEKLKENGVLDYLWEEFFEDYRLSVTLSLLTPVWQWVRGIEPSIWWPHLENICRAFEDLSCSEILKKN